MKFFLCLLKILLVRQYSLHGPQASWWPATNPFRKNGQHGSGTGRVQMKNRYFLVITLLLALISFRATAFAASTVTVSGERV